MTIRSRSGGEPEPGAAFYLAVNLLVLISLIIIFATNALHALIAVLPAIRLARTPVPAPGTSSSH